MSGALELSKMRSKKFLLDLAMLGFIGDLEESHFHKGVSSVYCSSGRYHIDCFSKVAAILGSAKIWPLISCNCPWIKVTHLVHINILFLVDGLEMKMSLF